MNRPKISVLMPVYNAQMYLREAIDSILNQTFIDFEFIIINDASIDSSKQIIRSYNDKRIRYFENNKNLGVARSLNRGLKLAKTNLVARMDADDISYPQRLEIEYREIAKDNKIAIVASFYEVIDKNGRCLYTIKDAGSAVAIFYTLQFRNCLGHPTVIFNKDIVLNEFHGYKNCQAEDYNLWLRVSKKYKILKIAKVLHQLRISDSSRVSQFYSEITNDAILIAQNNLQSLTGQSINVDTIKILANIKLLNYPPQRIKEALFTLKEINTILLNYHPPFLSRLIINKQYFNKIISLRYYLLIVMFFNSWFGTFFKSIYQLYRLIKYP